MEDRDLIKVASEALREAYAPYSKYRVGASVRARSGEIFRGSNVENASFGLTICAERSAIFAAVAAGHRDIEVIAVVGEKRRLPVPCGACLQVMSEFGVKRVIVGRLGEDFKVYELKELLPEPFKF